MAVKIRLKRMGKIRQPYYRVVVVDARKKRDGRVIEEIGKYHPKEEPSFIEVASERAQYWLGVGAQPSDAVAALLKITGDWQTFKGLPGTQGTLRTKEPKRDKQELFAEALKDASSEPRGDAVTRKKATAKKMAQSETPDKSTEKAATAKPAEVKPEKATPEAPAAEAATAKPAAAKPDQAAEAKAKPEKATPEAPAAEAAEVKPAEAKPDEAAADAEAKPDETTPEAPAAEAAEVKPDEAKPDEAAADADVDGDEKAASESGA